MKNIPLLFLGMALFAGTVIAQTDNIGHTRHTVKHGAAHPVEATSPERFTTSRNPQATLVLPSEKESFTFVVFADRTTGAVEDVSVLADAVRETNLIEPDFVINIGDMVNGYNATLLWTEQMREYKGIMKELQCPWFPTAGNHDSYWRGADRPAKEHESNIETHFGPVWYAFEHKNNWFIVLYTDEGNPETGEKAFNKPECQTMSDTQFEWLQSILQKAKDAEHVFVFQHHPRWQKGQYGDDWDKVHNALVAAGNVSAVFAGHIHRMDYSMKDGIEYFTLATTGGSQGGAIPRAGFLHEVHQVTVRPSKIGVATIPIGALIDPREITKALTDELSKLQQQPMNITPTIALQPNGFCEELISVPFENTSSAAIDVQFSLDSKDSRWSFVPEQIQAKLQPGEKKTFEFNVKRMAPSIDAAMRRIALKRTITFLTAGTRIPIPETQADVPLDLSELFKQDAIESEQVLLVDGNGDALCVPNEIIALPDGPLTIETWFRAEEYNERTALATKTENSEYGIFVNNGHPEFSVLLGKNYAVVKRNDLTIETGKWCHIAGLFDGKELRLYLDGQLIGKTPGTGKRRVNSFPLYLGADPNAEGKPVSFFHGELDSFRLSKTARYSGESFVPQRHFTSDADTVLLFDMQQNTGPWVPNRVQTKDAALLIDDARFVPLQP